MTDDLSSQWTEKYILRRIHTIKFVKTRIRANYTFYIKMIYF